MKFIKRCIELIGKALGWPIRMLYEVMWKPRHYIKVRPACLTAFVALTGFALALLIFLEFLTSNHNLRLRLPECSGPAAIPSFPPMRVSGGSGSSARNIAVDPNENTWVDKLANIFCDSGRHQSITHNTGTISIRNLVIDQNKNPWIDDLLEVLRRAVESQVADMEARKHILSAINSNLTEINKQLGNQRTLLPCNPTGTQAGEGCANNRDVLVILEQDASASKLKDALEQIQKQLSDNNSPALNVVIDPEKNQAFIEAMKAVGSPQSCVTDAGKNRGSDSKSPACDVIVTLEEPLWVNNLVKALHGVVEFYAIDPAIRSDIKEHLKCDNGKHLSVSGLIRFSGGEHSLDGAAKDSIGSFVTRIDRRASRWGVFGFASEAGDAEENRQLSWQRACAVKEHICKNDADSSLCKLDCETYPKDRSGRTATRLQCLPVEGDEKTYPLICFLGEQHFINGVADSRSVVIAACKAKE
ncbi:MAG: hypothetical protein OXS28_15265 [Gammaproteobacteria bacterium]|nr:hypothetical protein [Gammaproteobacteria bacterium]